MTTMPRRVFFLLLFVVCVSLAADGAVDLKESCSTTRYPELCVSVLSANPASKMADTRGLALIAIRTAAKMAEEANKAVHDELEANSDEKTRYSFGRGNAKDTQASRDYDCFLDYCMHPIQAATKALYRRDDDEMYKSARYYFQADYGRWDWNCERCHIPGTPKLPNIISKGSDFDKFMKVTSKLVMQVPGGDIPPPPPNEFANGTS